jgi:hypothetical protein
VHLLVDADAAMKVGILTASISSNAGGSVLGRAFAERQPDRMPAATFGFLAVTMTAPTKIGAPGAVCRLIVQATIGPRAFGFQRGLLHRL